MIFGIDLQNKDQFSSFLYKVHSSHFMVKGYNEEEKRHVRFKKACARAGSFTTLQDFQFLQCGNDFPTINVYGKQLHTGSHDHDLISSLIPSTFYATGPPDTFPAMDHLYKATSFRASNDSVLFSLYYHADYGRLDLSPYLTYAKLLGKSYAYVEIVIAGRRPITIPFDMNMVVQRETPQSVKNEDCDRPFDSLNEMLADETVSPSFKKIVVRIGDSMMSMAINSYTRGFSPKSLVERQGFVGGVAGHWSYADYGDFVLKYFLLPSQRKFYTSSEWLFGLVASLLRGKYVLTPVYSFSPSKGESVNQVEITSLETCHCSNQWVCDPKAMENLFKTRLMGKGNYSTHVSLSNYFDSYMHTPYLSNNMKSSVVEPSSMPCGICPENRRGCGRLKHHHIDRSLAITNFNYGIVGYSATVQKALGGSYVLTNPSYGVSFLKYQSLSVVPALLMSLPTTPDLCGCSFGENCYECKDSEVQVHTTFVSTLIGRYAYEWNDNFGLYMKNGQPYVMGNIHEKPCYSDYSSELTVVSTDQKLSRISKAKKLLSDLYRDYMSSRSVRAHVHPLESSYFSQGSTDISGCLTDADINWRFFGTLTMLRHASPRSIYTNAWYMVQDYSANCLSVSYKSEDAALEFSSLLCVLDEFGQYGQSLSVQDIERLTRELSS
jgi:hypothetical protein